MTWDFLVKEGSGQGENINHLHILIWLFVAGDLTKKSYFHHFCEVAIVQDLMEG